MSYSPDELHGICAMMPAFSTDDAGSLTATNTVNVQDIRDGLNRAIADGIGMVATTGTFGQVWNLLPNEWETLVRTSIEVVNKRVPLMLGVTSDNPREVVQKMRFVRDAGGEGVLLGLTYYEPLPIGDIATFYRSVAEMFPELSIMIYHNPVNHKVHIPVFVFEDLVKIPNIVAMKDSHRTPTEFIKLHSIIDGHIAHFVNQTQLYPYYSMGAQGCWSHAIWGGIWPVMALMMAIEEGDNEKAKEIILDMTSGGGGGDEDARARRGHASYEYSSYVHFGPPRAPHAFGMEGSEEKARKTAARWDKLCEKYRPEVEARRAPVAV